jgi:hypothetical protein
MSIAFASSATDLAPADSSEQQVFQWTESAAAQPGHFFSVVQCRLFDSRSAADSPAVTSGPARSFQGVDRCGIPATARALSVNVTVVSPPAAGFVQIYPRDQAPPLASTVNFSAGPTRANNAIVALAGDGTGTFAARTFLVNGGAVEVIVDVNGYFE